MLIFCVFMFFVIVIVNVIVFRSYRVRRNCAVICRIWQHKQVTFQLAITGDSKNIRSCAMFKAIFET